MTLPSRFRMAVLLCMLLVACREKKDIPVSSFSISADSLISQGKMILILADVHVAEGALLLERNEGIGLSHGQAYYYKGIFEKFHISPRQYDQNLTFYRQNPENFARMYEKVIILIEDRQKKISGKK